MHDRSEFTWPEHQAPHRVQPNDPQVIAYADAYAQNGASTFFIAERLSAQYDLSAVSAYVVATAAIDRAAVAPTGPCEWFAKCGNAATTVRSHPVLGNVPICERCAALVANL